MKEKKLETIKNLLGSNKIRGLWDNDRGEIYFPVIDIVRALTDTKKPYYYWKILKERMQDEGCDISKIIRYVKLKSRKGKYNLTELCDTEGMFRIIQEIPSEKAERVKKWLANLGRETVDEIDNPDILANRTINYYREIGYSEEEISNIINGVIGAKKIIEIFPEWLLKDDVKVDGIHNGAPVIRLGSIDINDFLSFVATNKHTDGEV